MDGQANSETVEQESVEEQRPTRVERELLKGIKEDRYWWMSYIQNPGGMRSIEECTCVGGHPFEYIADMEKESGQTTVLMNWRELTKEEYILWAKLFGHKIEEETKA